MDNDTVVPWPAVENWVTPHYVRPFSPIFHRLILEDSTFISLHLCEIMPMSHDRDPELIFIPDLHVCHLRSAVELLPQACYMQ